MSRKRTFVVAAATAVVMALVGGLASAGAGAGDSGNDVAGTWKFTINRPAPLPPLTSLQIYMSDGSWIETSNEPPATRSSQYGSWERIEGRLYASTGVIIRFDPQTGAQVGSMKINRTMRLSQDGQSMAVVARATTYDLQGNVIASFPVVASGERLQVERIPDEP
jgi:hypothetical protein